MDYAKFAIIFWIIATISIAIVGKEAFFKIFGLPKNKFLKVDWKAYLVTAMALGAVIAMGVTFLVKSLS
jgi:hypothetical protein